MCFRLFSTLKQSVSQQLKERAVYPMHAERQASEAAGEENVQPLQPYGLRGAVRPPACNRLDSSYWILDLISSISLHSTVLLHFLVLYDTSSLCRGGIRRRLCVQELLTVRCFAR